MPCNGRGGRTAVPAGLDTPSIVEGGGDRLERHASGRRAVTMTRRLDSRRLYDRHHHYHDHLHDDDEVGATKDPARGDPFARWQAAR